MEMIFMFITDASLWVILRVELVPYLNSDLFALS
jgi:hypothetical protein